MASSNGNTGVQKWARTWSKALNDQAQFVHDKLHGKVPPIENDALQEERRELNEYAMLCQSLQKNLTGFGNLLQTISNETASAVEINKAVSLCEFAASQELQELTQRNDAAWSVISRHYDVTKGRVHQLEFEVKNRLMLIQQAQKAFEHRDKRAKKRGDERRKLDKVRDGGSATTQQLEKCMLRYEKATLEFTKSTTDVSEQINHLLAGRQRFLQDTMRSRIEIQSEFFSKVAKALADGMVDERVYKPIRASSHDNVRDSSMYVGMRPIPNAQSSKQTDMNSRITERPSSKDSHDSHLDLI